jgi:hypothetical protein
MEIFMTDNIVTFPQRRPTLKVEVSNLELFEMLYLGMAQTPHGELSDLELTTAVIAASCYKGAWIDHTVSGKHIGLAFSSFWRPAKIAPSVQLLMDLAKCNQRYADLPYKAHLRLLASHAMFMQEQFMRLIPLLRIVIQQETVEDDFGLLEYLSFSKPFAGPPNRVDADTLNAMFQLLEDGYRECQTQNVAPSDAMTLCRQTCFVAAGARTYVLKKHKPARACE